VRRLGAGGIRRRDARSGVLVLYCREQFVVEEITIIGHRDLAPPWWEQPFDE